MNKQMAMDELTLKKEFEQELNGDKLFLYLPNELRNSIWAENYGDIQKQLRNIDNVVKDVVICGCGLKWADPFPMLSLLISIAEIHLNKRIFFLVPSLSDMSEKQKRVYEFMEKEGFLSVMQEYGVHVLERDVFDESNSNEKFKKLTERTIRWMHDNLNGFIYFSNSTILKARVVDLGHTKKESQIDRDIELELESVKHRISSFLRPSQLNEIIWKTGLFLKEAINNVYEHAYGNNRTKYVGYYIRHRTGLTDNTLSPTSRKDLEKSFNSEMRDVKCFVKNFPMTTTNFLEIYVIDAGIGLTKHFSLKRNYVKMSFREAWRETIGLGQRGIEKEKYTHFGGLYTLGKLLDKEFLLARDYDYWIGDVIPVVATNGSYVAACSKGEDHYVQGLSLMSRLAILQPMDYKDWVLSPDCGVCFIEAMKEERSIYEKYFHCSYSKMPFCLSYIKDNRYDVSFMDNVKYLEQKEGVKFCFFLPSEHVSKNGIYDYITEIKSLAGISNDSKTVIIADIPVNECGLYQQALKDAYFKSGFTKRVERIIMISQRLSVYVLIKQGETYVDSYSETMKYIQNKPKDFSPHLSLLHAVEWLKTHDSMLTWQYIAQKNATEGFYVNHNVRWYKDDEENVLNGYLDFEKTLTDTFLKKMYHNVLQRTLCLAPETGCTYTADDPLMTGMADYMNNLFYNKTSAGESPLVALGSVYVSGATQTPNVTYNINLYLHKDSSQYASKNSVMHLLAWPEKDLFPRKKDKSILEQSYRRVGSTYAIAPFGWRYFPIPRYKARLMNGNGDISNRYFFTKDEMNYVEFKQVYKCAPKETYNYWQGRNGMFVGISHVDYETKHDILNINFPFIVKESFLLGSDLARFLLGEIMAAFNLKEDDMNFHENVKFKQDVLQYKKQEEKKYEHRKCSFLIYPYHSNTERIVDIIKEYLINNDVKIIPLIPLNKERNGTSFQPSPLTIEMLKKTILVQRVKNKDGIGEKEINALLLDDAIIDGKTQEEIKHVMYGLGIRHIMSVFILERRRIPYNTSDCRKTSAFWRLDIPRLGSKYSCPLCAAINSISDFSSQIVSENARKRVLEWIDIWGARTENTLERVQTLTPVKIHLEQPAKRFGIYFEDGLCKQCGGESNKIELLTSLGLTLYMGELLSITSRDDKMLQYCSERFCLDSLTILEMLCTNLLLYGKTISRKVREKIVCYIFDRANSIIECNNHTAFAALVLMTQENEVLACLKDKYNEMIRSNVRPNYDILILLSYLSQRAKESFGHFEEARKLRQTSMTEDKAYKLFHSELFNGDGRTHTRPIGRLIEDAISTTQDLRRVEDAMDCLKYALDYIYDWNLSDWCKKDNDIRINEAQEMIGKTRNVINGMTWEDYEPKKTKYIVEISNLSICLSKVHDRLFIPLNIINDNRPYKDDFKLKDRISLWMGKYDIALHRFDRKNVGCSNIYERWMIWDMTVDNEIEYLLNNAQTHSKGIIGNGEKHAIWISIEYAEDLSTVSLLIYNKTSSKKNAKYIRQETAKKTRYGKNRLTEELRIKVEYTDVDNNIIQTKVTFPLL